MVGYAHPVLDHFHRPRHAGVAADYTHSYFEDSNPWLIRIRFTLRVRDGKVEEAAFQAQGCVTTIACASALTEMVTGATVAGAAAVTPDQLSDRLGVVPAEKMHCCRLAVATLRQALTGRDL